MKRFLALALALLLAALPALAEINYSEEPLADGSVLCRFGDLTIVLPADWDGKVLIREGGNGLDFYQAGSYEAYQAEGLEGGGFLFMLGASEDDSFSELPSFRFLGFSEDSAMNYFMVLPSDYPAYTGDEAVRAEYDAMLSQVEAIAQSAVIQGNEIVEDGNDLGEVVEEETPSGVTVAQLRYHFEHSALPRYFYEDPVTMLDVLDQVGAFTLFASLGDENGVAYDYTAEDFGQALYASADGTLLLQLDLPQPENTPECYRIYMLYNPDTQAATYYTLEYDAMAAELGGSGESAFLCRWDADGTHRNFGMVNVPRKGIEAYDAALLAEAEELADYAGIDPNLSPADAGGGDGTKRADTDGLALIECPEQGFTVMADPDYAWDYQEGTGISIYTQTRNSIPYVIVYRNEDLLAEPLDFIREQYTPHMQAKYGEDLVSYVEYEVYDVGGKSLPAGLYTYRLQNVLVNALRIYDSTGPNTVTYTAKYVQGEGDATLAALDTAIRTYQAQ